jgi:radical SAM protein with 4Fe4S-binding SPASM domain
MSACIINYDGNVFGSDEARMLYESTKNSVLPLGKIINDKLVPNKMAAHESILSSSFSELTPHCDTCAYMPFCGSDPIHHLASQGDFVGFKPNSDFCQQTITMNDLLINKIKSGEITNEMVALWLNH